MSSKFSRRSTRVQPKPKVCKSDPVPPSPPPPTPSSLGIMPPWNVPDGLFSASSYATNTQLTQVGSSFFWTATGFDDQGNPFEITVELQHPSGTSSCVIEIFGTSLGDLVLTGSTNAWDENEPWLSNLADLTMGPDSVGSFDLHVPWT